MKLLQQLVARGATTSIRGEELSTVTHDSHVLDLEYLPNLDLFAIAINDLSISFWDASKVLNQGQSKISGQPSQKPEPIARVYALTPQQFAAAARFLQAGCKGKACCYVR